MFDCERRRVVWALRVHLVVRLEPFPVYPHGELPSDCDVSRKPEKVRARRVEQIVPLRFVTLQFHYVVFPPPITVMSNSASL